MQGERVDDRPGRCPVCGKGDLVDVAFDAGTGQDASPVTGRPMQLADSREVDVYSCGHEVPGRTLDIADEPLQVEHRGSAETTEPVEEPDSRRTVDPAR